MSCGPEVTEVSDEYLNERGEASESRQPHQPSNEEGWRWSERFSSIEIWTTSSTKTASDFREAQSDQTDDDRANNERQQTVVAHKPLHVRRKFEDPGAYRDIDQ